LNTNKINSILLIILLVSSSISLAGAELQPFVVPSFEQNFETSLDNSRNISYQSQQKQLSVNLSEDVGVSSNDKSGSIDDGIPSEIYRIDISELIGIFSNDKSNDGLPNESNETNQQPLEERFRYF